MKSINNPFALQRYCSTRTLTSSRVSEHVSPRVGVVLAGSKARNAIKLSGGVSGGIHSGRDGAEENGISLKWENLRHMGRTPSLKEELVMVLGVKIVITIVF